MIRHSNSVVSKAREMMMKGNLSCREVALNLGVNDSVVSKWCRGIENEKNRNYVEKRAVCVNKLLSSESLVAKKIDWDSEKIKFYCALIYGCEGAKYPASNNMSLANSDPKLIQSFVNLMRKAFVLDENKWRVLLQIHDNQNFSELRKYWSLLLKIPEHRFYRPTVTKASQKKRSKEYFGTCTVRYASYELQLKLIGLYQEFMKQSLFI